MKLTLLCKSANSYEVDDCPAMYVTEDPTVMVGQGTRLDDETTAELLHLGDGEIGIAIPTETVLRAVGLFLAARGRPAVAAEVESFLSAQPEGQP
jgi:hypothetical protein